MIPKLLVMFLALGITTATIVKADKSGKSGRTVVAGEGCGDCHGLNPSTSTSVQLHGVVAHSITMAPGETKAFTIEVAHGSMLAAGVNIAVKTTATGSTDAGTLIAPTGSGLKVKVNELVHSAPKAMQGGVAQFIFSFKAPATPGTYFLRATGNAVNLDDIESVDDQWNFMPTVSIVVADPTSVTESTPVLSDISPQPMGDASFATISGVVDGVYEIDVMDATGILLLNGASGSATNGQMALPSAVATLPRGVYAIIIRSQSEARRMMFVR